MTPDTSDRSTNADAGNPSPAGSLSHRQRLAESFALLEKIQIERPCQEDVAFGQLIEDRIVWRELIDLELQDIDEQMERLTLSCEAP